MAALLCALTGSASLYAQTGGRPGQQASGPGEVRGIVIDEETRAPIAWATVELLTETGNELVAGEIATADGGFRIEGLRPGRYTLKVTMIGY
ncbi:MAG: carboxypeptidase-like regulatory domain-containing protein, partial [Longimicrobiales bacterium]